MNSLQKEYFQAPFFKEYNNKLKIGIFVINFQHGNINDFFLFPHESKNIRLQLFANISLDFFLPAIFKFLLIRFTTFDNRNTIMTVKEKKNVRKGFKKYMYKKKKQS